MKSEVADSQVQFLCRRFIPRERSRGSARSLTPISCSGGREASRRGLALSKAAGSGWEGQELGAATPGGREKSGPKKAVAKHGSRVGRRARRESTGPVGNKIPTEPASAIYFRDLKPISGSQDGVPMTTDVGSLRKPHFEVDWEGLGGRLPWGQKERGRERWTDRRRLRYLANLCCPKAEGTGLLPVELAAGGSLSRILTTARRGGP